MPTINVYLNERVYWQVAKYADKWQMTVGKAAAKIIEKGIKALEGEEKRLRKKGVIA